MQVHIVILDQNDNPPRFTQPTYEAEIAENVALHPPAAILKVSSAIYKRKTIREIPPQPRALFRSH